MFMSESRTILGIDIGAVSVALCELSIDGDVRASAYRIHQGDIRSVVLALLDELELDRVGWIGCTGSAPAHVPSGRVVDRQLAHIAAVRRHHAEPGTIIVLGGERFRDQIEALGQRRAASKGVGRPRKGNTRV